jgi:hypothetical protein
MPSIENLKVLFVLLPGFLSQRIAHYFGTQYSVSSFDAIISALAFTTINYMLSLPIGRCLKIETTNEENHVNQKFIIIVFIMSIITGFGWATIDRNDILYKAGLTTRTSSAHAWTKIFTDNDRWKAFVKIRLKDDREFIGWPHYRSEQQEQNNILFLSPAYRIDENQSCEKTIGFGLLLFEREMKEIEFIQLPENSRSPCDSLKHSD